MPVGSTYLAEWRSYADPQTGRLVRQLTSVGNMYLTACSCWARPPALTRPCPARDRMRGTCTSSGARTARASTSTAAGWPTKPAPSPAGATRPASTLPATLTTRRATSTATTTLHPTELTLVTDGEAAAGCISKVHCRDGQQVFEKLCWHDTVEPEEDQHTHSHPSFTPDGRQVVFTAARPVINVYLVDWN